MDTEQATSPVLAYWLKDMPPEWQAIMTLDKGDLL
jgi:hypothetical protein